MKVLVCGSRDWQDRDRINAVVAELVGEGLVPKDRRGTQENLKPGGRKLRAVA
jgi:hypothetical protein